MEKRQSLIRMFALGVIFPGVWALSSGLAVAGELPEKTQGAAAPPSVSKQAEPEGGASAPASVKALEAKLAQQQGQIEKLTRAVELLSQRLNNTSQASSAEAPHPAIVGQVSSLVPVIPASLNAAPASTAALSVPLAPASAPVTQAEMQQYTDKVDQLGKSLDGALKNLGGFKFSGDLRFRTDGIFRSGNSVAGPQQNLRERYRLRLSADKALNGQFDTHFQLASGPANNPLTFDTDFAGMTVRQPFFISEVYADYHPNSKVSLRGGKMSEVFADNSRFLFDDDIRFNGFQEIVKLPVAKNPLGITLVELRGAQYFLSNPNVQILSSSSPFVSAGFVPGTKVRDANLFHLGFAIFGDISSGWSHQFFGDLQWYRNPNQIALASTTAGFPVLVNGTFGLALSEGLGAGGTATTTPGGAIFSARNFQIARINYRITHKGWKIGDREMPVWLDLQAARNLGTSKLRDAFMGTLNVGDVKKFGDVRFLYIFAIKDANAMISQVTDDDLGTGSGVNITTHHIRVDLGLTKFLQWQNLLFVQDERRPSNPADLFFVPLQRGTETQYRVQSQLQFTF